MQVNNNQYAMEYKQIPSIDNKIESLIKENEIKIKDINNNIKEYEKNPNFYRNKQMIAVAVAIAAIAVTAILAYFCWGYYIPLIFGAIGTGHTSGAAAAGAFMIPIFPAVGGISGAAKLFKSFDSDNKALEELVAENNRLTNKIKSDIKLCNKHIELSDAAFAKDEQFSDKVWTALKDITSSNLDNIDTKIREVIWTQNLYQIVRFKNANFLAKQKLEAILDPKPIS